MTRVRGAGRDMEQVIAMNLFVICQNNSGSSFLSKALATCRATWSLPREGHGMRGFAGPRPREPVEPGCPSPRLIWAAEPSWVAAFADPGRYNWPRTRKTWYFQARARSPHASVFVTKSPPHVLCVDQLAQHFRNARFLFMVRNPYAVCEGICRRYRTRLVRHWSQFAAQGRSLPETAATHVVTCLAWQRRNIEAHRSRGVFFTYETMCAQPERVAQEIRALVPELDDLNLRQRLQVKDYDAMLTDMNARQIARLDAQDVAVFNRVFRPHRDLLDYFGYALM